MNDPAIARSPESEEEVVAFLRGRPWPPSHPPSFAAAAIRHGVAPLLMKAGASAWLPPPEAAMLADEARRQAVVAELRDRQLRDALEALHAAGAQALVMKGSHLAHTYYAESYLRPRGDSDLLVRAADRDVAARALGAAGYRLEKGANNRRVLGQMVFDRPGAAAASLDLHWRIVAPIRVARLFDVEQLFSRAVPIPALGLTAKGPGTADALAIACVHQVAHHPGDHLLLWAYDLHLLMASLGRAEVAAFLSEVCPRRLARTCLGALEPAARWFPSQTANDLIERLHGCAAAEPALAPRRKIDDLRADLASLAWRERPVLIFHHLFPPAEYMRTTYAPASPAPLPWLYTRRILVGARKWFVTLR